MCGLGLEGESLVQNAFNGWHYITSDPVDLRAPATHFLIPCPALLDLHPILPLFGNSAHTLLKACICGGRCSS